VQEVVVAILVRVTPGAGAEQVDPLGLERLDQATDGFGQRAPGRQQLGAALADADGGAPAAGVVLQPPARIEQPAGDDAPGDGRDGLGTGRQVGSSRAASEWANAPATDRMRSSAVMTTVRRSSARAT